MIGFSSINLVNIDSSSSISVKMVTYSSHLSNVFTTQPNNDWIVKVSSIYVEDKPPVCPYEVVSSINFVYDGC